MRALTRYSREIRHLAKTAVVVARQDHGKKLILAALLSRTGLSRLFTIKRETYRLKFQPSSYSRALWADKARGVHEEAVMCSLLTRGDRMVDVGANIGTLTLRAADQVGPTGSVVALEAHPRTFEFLTENVALNDFANITLINSAAGPEAGTTQFSDMRSDDQNFVQNVGGVTVPVMRLDDLLNDEVALLKIDVEGYELHVLRGSGSQLQNVAAIQFEYYETSLTRYGVSGAELLSWITAAGFVLTEHTPDGFRKIRPNFATSECVNLFAFRPGHPALSRR